MWVSVQGEGGITHLSHLTWLLLLTCGRKPLSTVPVPVGLNLLWMKFSFCVSQYSLTDEHVTLCSDNSLKCKGTNVSLYKSEVTFCSTNCLKRECALYWETEPIVEGI